MLRTEICAYCPIMERGPKEVCQYCSGGAPSIRADVSPGIIGQLPAITGSIKKVTVSWKGIDQQIWPTPTIPAKIPAGEMFDIYVDYAANNPGGGLWSTCATMIAADGSLANYDVTEQFYATSVSGTMKLDENGQPGPMPNKDITLRFTLFGHPYVERTPPPTSEW